MKVAPETVAQIAALAHLELTPAESLALQTDLSAILDYVDRLNQIDTTGVEEMAQAPTAPATELRADVARPGCSALEALANAPAADANMFLVPKVIERG